MCLRPFCLLKASSRSILYLLIFFLTACHSSQLSVYTDYLSHEQLASYVVGTPDPYLNNPMIGQRLIITWTLKKKHLLYQDLHLKISIRFRNKKELILKHPITQAKGTYVYALLNQDYIENDGILTYKVELFGDGCLIDEWRHQVWTNLILIGQSSPTGPNISNQLEKEEKEDYIDDFSDFDFDEQALSSK